MVKRHDADEPESDAKRPRGVHPEAAHADREPEPEPEPADPAQPSHPTITIDQIRPV